MKAADAYRLAIKLLKRMSTEHPSKVFTNKDGDKATILDVADHLERVVKWVSPELETRDIVRVVRCKNCIYYKKYRRKGAYKTVPFMACSKDMKKREPTFFCKDGVRE